MLSVTRPWTAVFPSAPRPELIIVRVLLDTPRTGAFWSQRTMINSSGGRRARAAP